MYPIGGMLRAKLRPIAGFLHLASCQPVGTREILASNLAALMEQRGDSVYTLAAKSERLTGSDDLSKSAVDRIRRGEGSCQIRHLDPLAAVYGMEPWQLLHPRMDPHASPQALDGDAMDLVHALHAITDPDLRRRAHAIALQVLALNPASEDRPGPSQQSQDNETPSIAPKVQPLRGQKKPS